MNKRLVRPLIIVSLLFSLATFAYAGTSTVMFDGSGGEILIVTSSPGIEIDNFQVVGKGEFSAKQQVSTYSPTTIIREGGFSGGGSMMVITQADAPQVEFGAYLQASDSGYLGQTIDTGSSVMFDLNIWGEGEGDLEEIIFLLVPLMPREIPSGGKELMFSRWLEPTLSAWNMLTTSQLTEW